MTQKWIGIVITIVLVVPLMAEQSPPEVSKLGASRVDVTDLGLFSKDDNNTMRYEERRISMNTGAAEFGLSNVNNWWKQGTYQGRISGGVGLYAPTVNLWYYQDAFTPIVGGKSLWLDHHPSFSVVDRGPRGIVDAIWRDGEAAVRVWFLAFPGSDHLLIDCVAEQKEPGKSFAMEFQGYPSTFTKEGARSVATALRETGRPNLLMKNVLSTALGHYFEYNERY